MSRRDPLSPLGRITGHPRTVLALWAALALAALPGVLKLETDNSPEVFYVDGSESVVRFEEMRRLFGSTDPLRLAASGEGLWTGEGLAWLARVEALAASVPGVEDAFGLAGHHGGIAREGDGDPSVAEGWPPADPEAFRRRALGDAVDRNLGLMGGLIGKPDQGGTATVLVAIASTDKEQKAETVAALRRLVADPPAGVQADVVGLPVLDLALDRSSREIERVFFPLLVALAVALLLASFRDLSGIAVPLVYVAAPELVLLGALGYLGVDLNLVLAVLPPLLFVIALATAVHLQVRFRDALEDGLRGAEAVRATYEDKGWAVLWTGVTTIVGFGSLAVSRVGPVPTLGLASAAGIALVTVAAFTLYPALLVAFGTPRRSLVGGAAGGRGRPRAFERRFRRLGRAWAEWAAGRRREVLAVALLAVALAAAGLPRLWVESNAVTFLPEEHPARTGIEGLEAAGVGVAAAEVFLTLPEDATESGAEDRGFGSATRVAELGELTGTLREIPRVLGAVGPGDLLAEALRRSRGAGGVGVTPELALGFLRSDPVAAARFRAFVTDDGRAARITLFVPTDGHRELEPLFERAGALTREWARRAFPGARVSVTGEFPLLLSTHRRLLATLGLSLTLTTLAVGVIFRFLLPSTRLTLLALLPNLWPVAMVVGTMAWTGIPLDTATVMVASVVLGLAVDDTIHTLGHFRELAPALGRREAVAGTLERTAPAYVLTGVILAAGFGVCALSDFAPTARFGGLSALAIAFAVAGDLFLLPALLGSTPRSVVGRLDRKRLTRRGLGR